MPIEGDSMFRDRDTIRNDLINIFRTKVPDVWLEEDGNLYQLFDVVAGVAEGLFVANQIVLEDGFIHLANESALDLHGIQLGVPRKLGTVAEGSLLFSGSGGTYVPLGTEVAYDRGFAEEPLYFVTNQDGTIPNPGVPGPPTAAQDAAAGVLTGTFEYAVSFMTVAGETPIGNASGGVTVSAKKINISAIALGGPGTTQRRIYRKKDGGAYALVTTIANNTATTFQDNVADGSLGGLPLSTDTARAILLTGESEEPGIDYNAVPGAITIVTAPPDGVTAVRNPAAFVGGSDPEDTEAYRARLLDHLRSPATGSVTDLQNWALEVDGVGSATAFPNMNMTTPTNGHVTVRIAGADGGIPDSEIVDAVQDALDARDIANMVIHVTTFTAQPLDVDVTVTLDPAYVLADVETSVEDAVTDYILSLGVGATAYPAGLVDAVFGLPGIVNVAITDPVAPVATDPTEKHTVGTITVTG